MDYYEDFVDDVRYGAGDVILRGGNFRHRIILEPGRECWTLFITGPRYRWLTWLHYRSDWGFHCRNGFVPWKRFVQQRDRGAIGAGCGD